MSSDYTAIADDSTLYIRTEDKLVYAYSIGTSLWYRLPDSPKYGCPFVIVNNLLTLVGGRTKYVVTTNQLFSLTGKGDNRRWTEVFPPMKTKRCGSSALCTGRALVVAGGFVNSVLLGDGVKTVEVMDTETFQWSTAADLPQPVARAPGAICGDRIYILSLKNDTKSMYTCSVSALLASQPTCIWNTVSAPPVMDTTCVSIHGRLLTLGGCGTNYGQHVLTDAVYMYDQVTDSWEIISHLIKPRSRCFAAVLPNNQLMVVGGWTDRGNDTDSVEVAAISDEGPFHNR